MTGNRDRFGELIEEDDIASVPPNESIRDEIHTDRCAELRRILKSARDRREAQQ